MTMNLEQVYERWERKVKAEGKAEAVIELLAARGLTVSAAQRRQVLACADDAVLVGWIRAASTTPSVAALLAGPVVKQPRAKRSRATGQRRPIQR